MKEGSSAELFPQNRLMHKRRFIAARPGHSCCRHHAGLEHLEIMGGWIPKEPNFPEGSLPHIEAGLEHLPSLHWLVPAAGLITQCCLWGRCFILAVPSSSWHSPSLAPSHLCHCS